MLFKQEGLSPSSRQPTAATVNVTSSNTNPDTPNASNTNDTSNAAAIPFQHAEFGQVRVVMDDVSGEPWFVAKDVCRVLEIEKYRDALASLDADEKGCPAIVDTPGGPQQMTTISESGLYSLIFRSRKPEARTFRKWVTAEVLPTIRKHGGYLTPAKVEEALLNPSNTNPSNTNATSNAAAIPFQHAEFGQVRVVMNDGESGEPWFVAKDVALALGHVWKGMDSIRHVPEEWKGVHTEWTPGGKQEMLCLSEPGLYFFLARSVCGQGYSGNAGVSYGK